MSGGSDLRVEGLRMILDAESVCPASRVCDLNAVTRIIWIGAICVTGDGYFS